MLRILISLVVIVITFLICFILFFSVKLHITNGSKQVVENITLQYGPDANDKISIESLNPNETKSFSIPPKESSFLLEYKIDGTQTSKVIDEYLTDLSRGERFLLISQDKVQYGQDPLH